MRTPYATRLVPTAWAAAGWVGAGYGVFLTVLALRSAPGEALTGHWIGQPAFKAAMAVLLAVAAAAHPILREARWLIPALILSAAGDWLLAIPWWEPSFVAGLTAFLLAHLCFLGALIPLAVVSRARLIGVGLTVVSCLVLLVWFWPGLVREQMTVPVTVYVGVLGAMVCAALLAKLPTRWTAVGAAFFAVSDAMIAISRFVLGNEVLAVPIWWAYAAAQLLITAGFFFGRSQRAEQTAAG
ncbi:lysoplasmalogenase [Mycolicibacter terrae]|uniref:Lysoplasmalogenase n=1 Tax=Mycolicibacter terrae TaxID=1788 RepID=A0ACD2ELQ4_9MYCO|nr:lysoplasmalogenase [Mycolicibacter terrae]RRR43840.1 lysoplasmalogenase [Mycolicibacter terrae]